MFFIEHYGYFLLCTLTIVLAIIATIAGILALSAKAKLKARGELVVSNITEQLEQQSLNLQQEVLDKATLKALKKQKKAEKKQQRENNPRLFVLSFNGDMQASTVYNLTQCINAILLCAQQGDRVLAQIESPGGVVHGYGLGASQLQRLVDAKLHLTVAIDKVAASGGYMMASVADHIISAPFAIIGSIGVLAQIPNFNKLLKKHDIEFEQITAGDYKRTLSLFGENNEAGREKMQQDINDTHELFKAHVSAHRPKADINHVATGEYWYGQKALDLNLVDELKTADQHLIDQNKNYTVYKIEYKMKHSLQKRIGLGVEALFKQFGQH